MATPDGRGAAERPAIAAPVVNIIFDADVLAAGRQADVAAAILVIAMLDPPAGDRGAVRCRDRPPQAHIELTGEIEPERQSPNQKRTNCSGKDYTSEPEEEAAMSDASTVILDAQAAPRLASAPWKRRGSAVAGLVAITPAAGAVDIGGAVAIGAIAFVALFFAAKLLLDVWSITEARRLPRWLLSRARALQRRPPRTSTPPSARASGSANCAAAGSACASTATSSASTRSCTRSSAATPTTRTRSAPAGPRRFRTTAGPTRKTKERPRFHIDNDAKFARRAK